MKRGFFLLTVQLTMAVALVFSAVSGVPMLLSHQGRLLDASDQPVTGTRNITFHIFEVETGGVALWTEPHADVPIDEGLFHVTLGGSVTISGDLLVSSGTLESSR